MVDCLPSMGSGIDPLIIGLSLLLLGVGAAAIVWARRKRGAAMLLFLPLVFGAFLFSGASATPAQAACACVPTIVVSDLEVDAGESQFDIFNTFGEDPDGDGPLEEPVTGAYIELYPLVGQASLTALYEALAADPTATVTGTVTFETTEGTVVLTVDPDIDPSFDGLYAEIVSATPALPTPFDRGDVWDLIVDTTDQLTLVPGDLVFTITYNNGCAAATVTVHAASTWSHPAE